MEHKFLRREDLATGMWMCCSAPKERSYLCLYLKLQCVCACGISRVKLFDPMDVALQALLSGILQARILDWVAISFSRASSWPSNQTHVSYIACIGKWALYQLSHWGTPKSKNYSVLEETMWNTLRITFTRWMTNGWISLSP